MDTNGALETTSLTVTVKDAAALLGVAPRTLYKAISNNEFPHIKVGKRVRVSKVVLREMLGANV